MSIVVYWITKADPEAFLPGFTEPKCKTFTGKELNEALRFTETQRKLGFRHVTLSSEMEDSVGKPGVTSVENGRTPDGEIYDWSKAHRAGKMRKSDKAIVTKD